MGGQHVLAQRHTTFLKLKDTLVIITSNYLSIIGHVVINVTEISFSIFQHG